MEAFMDGAPDHLGSAAQAKHAAKQAIKEKRFDDAWRLLHEQQSHWLADCGAKGRTQKQTLSLLYLESRRMVSKYLESKGILGLRYINGVENQGSESIVVVNPNLVHIHEVVELVVG